jgi:hypothetical protein
MLEQGSKVLRRSRDQGKSWIPVDGLQWSDSKPESLVLHPYAQEDTVLRAPLKLIISHAHVNYPLGIGNRPF